MNRSSLIALGAMASLSAAGIANAATAERSSAGTLRDGPSVEGVTLRNASGVSARIIAYGATLQSLIAPDRKGRRADIVLGHDTAGEYEDRQDFFGVTVGR